MRPNIPKLMQKRANYRAALPEPDIRADMVFEAMKGRGYKDAANNLHDRWAQYNEWQRAKIFKAWNRETVL